MPCLVIGRGWFYWITQTKICNNDILVIQLIFLNLVYFSICGGVLVTSKHVVTAAHCVTSSLTSVVLGEHDLTTEYDCFDGECEGPQCVDEGDCAPKHQVIQVKNSTMHPRYKELKQRESHSEFDIALLTLEKRASFNDFVYPICLPKLEPDNFVKRRPLKILGWGDTIAGYEKQHADRLQQLDVSEIMLWNCDLKFKSFSTTDFK